MFTNIRIVVMKIEDLLFMPNHKLYQKGYTSKYNLQQSFQLIYPKSTYYGNGIIIKRNTEHQS